MQCGPTAPRPRPAATSCPPFSVTTQSSFPHHVASPVELVRYTIIGFFLLVFVSVAPAGEPSGRFLTLTTPLDDAILERVASTASQLRTQAEKNQEKAYLVLQLEPGLSPFHQAKGLAKLLGSLRNSPVVTVAWVPQSLSGANVLVALACQQLILHPRAEIGDIGRGGPLEPDELQDVLAVVGWRANPLMNEAVVRGFADPQVAVLRVKARFNEDQEQSTSRIITQTELEVLRKNGAIIDETTSLKDVRQIGVLNGVTARKWGVLVTATAETRAEVARLLKLPKEAMYEPTANDAARARGMLIRLTAALTPAVESYIERQIQRSIDDGMRLIVFEINSPGGFVKLGEQLALQIASLSDQNVRTVAYIPERAHGAAALVALGCDEIYMAPSATLGDIGSGLMIEGHRDRQQFEDPARALLINQLAEMATRKQRPAALVTAMIVPDTVVLEAENREEPGRKQFFTQQELQNLGNQWRAGQMVRETTDGKCLVLGTARAQELGIADGPIESMAALQMRLGGMLDAKLQTAEATWVDQLIFFLLSPGVTVLVFVLAFGFLYLELHFNHAIFAVLSALCFTLFFWSRFLGGTAGWLEVMLFLLGAILLAIELFLIPGFGIVGFSGIAMMLASLVMASQTFNNLEPWADFSQMTGTMGTFVSTLAIVGVGAVGLSRLLPRMPFYDHLVLTPPGGDAGVDGEVEPQLRPESTTTATSQLVGRAGTAITILRPAGKAQIGERLLDVISDGGYIPAGTPITIVDVEGSRVVVRAT